MQELAGETVCGTVQILDYATIHVRVAMIFLFAFQRIAHDDILNRDDAARLPVTAFLMPRCRCRREFPLRGSTVFRPRIERKETRDEDFESCRDH